MKVTGIFPTLGILVAIALPSAIHAADCKGKSHSACESSSSCSWVDGYTRKDGVKVKSHCKGKSGKASKSKGGSSEKKKAKKSKESSSKSED